MAGTLALKTIFNMLYYSGAQSLMRFWMSGLGGILMLHHVRDEEPRPFSPNAGLAVAPAFLDRLLCRLANAGVDFVSMDDLARRLRSHSAGDRPDPMIAVTLDDGYRDNLAEAVPIFRKYKVPYTIYVTPGLVDGQADLWWEDLEAIIAAKSDFYLQSPKGRVAFDVSTAARKRAVFAELTEFLAYSVSEYEQRRIVRELAKQARIDTGENRRREIMTWHELAELANDRLCTIGAHTIHHYALSRLDEAEAQRELVESASIIEMELGSRPRHFAYPYGSGREAGTREFRIAADAGYETAVTTRHGVLYPEHAGHMQALPRISLNGHFQAQRYVDTLLSGLPCRLQNRGSRVNVT